MAVSSAQSSLVRQSVGVALLACGSILTIYGGWQLRGAFGSLFGNQVANAAVPFLLLALPLFAVYALLERRDFTLTRWLGLPVGPRESWLASAAAFAVLGVFWVFIKGSNSYRAAAKADATLAKPASPNAPPPLRAPGREFVETVVFVVVLVSMLNVFVVQAFVIPTGSMAETLYGYNKVLTCPECGYEFVVNASDEVDPQNGRPRQKLTGYCCPNCRYETPTGADQAAHKDLFGHPTAESGDRVLVGKFLDVDHRGRVVVFKYPDAPQTGQVAQNYIKRLVGLPGETIAIHGGDLYVTRELTYPTDELDVLDRPVDPKQLWRSRFTHPNSSESLALFEQSKKDGFQPGGGFEIVRKPDDLVMAERRIVYDNDHQSKSLVAGGMPPRWSADPDGGTGWAADDPKAPKAFTHSGGEFGWVRYQHLMPPHQVMIDPRLKPMHQVPTAPPLGAEPAYRRPGWAADASVALSPRKITNYQGYNGGYPETAKAVPRSYEEEQLKRDEDERIKRGELTEKDRQWGKFYQDHMSNSDYWVGDLMVECTATFGDAAAVVLELGKGEHRYRAEFAGGQVRLKRFKSVEWRVERKLVDGKDTRIATTRLKPLPPPGQDDLVLAGGSAVRPTGITGGTHALRFANVDSRLRVWVDDKPIDFGGDADYPPPLPADEQEKEDEENKEGWTRANDLERPACVGASGAAVVSGLKVWRDTFYVNNSGEKVDTYYVRPGHYLCMGDNSSQSSDGRMWGLVPERLMLGRAVFIFWPVERIGFIK
jgi:signal peptidase I